jgi:hypothetical protein
MVYRFCKKAYTSIRNSQGGDENISSFSAMGKDQTPLFYAGEKGACLALIWVPLQRPREDFRAG